MADGEARFSARTVASISEIDHRAWDDLAAATGHPYNPFTSHAFLAALEKSQSVGVEAGWVPMHLVLENEGAMVGAAPLYMKSHSQGEYIFDHHWADAYERAGGRYFPKLLCAAPFTPVTGPRALAATLPHKKALGAAMIQIAEQIGASSVHVNFIEEEYSDAISNLTYLARTGTQYHWFNRNYRSFDDFLATLSSRKRKAVKKERRLATENGLTIRSLRGNEIQEHHWHAFWEFYQDTGMRKWGHPYLTRFFFSEIAMSMRDDLLMIVAERDGTPIAGALNFIGGDTLYGRYWGCTEHHSCLHFEICYHRAIDYAIEHGLKCVEAGAQGEHKIARGYEPVMTHSAHWIADPSFRQAIQHYLENERSHCEAEHEALAQFTPYKKE